MLVTKLLESLPQRAYSATQVLENEAKIAAKIPIAMTALMEKAGSAVFNLLHHSYPQLSSLLVIAGKGNNGGDGFVIARLAAELGVQVTVYLCCQPEQIKGNAKTAFQRLLRSDITIMYQNDLTISQEFLQGEQFQLIVDAIFGIGFKGQLTPEIAQLVEQVNQSGINVLSVDVPSGLNATTGDVANNAIIARQTVTFIAPKQGLLTGKAAHYCGELYFASLGLADTFQSVIHSNVYLQGGAKSSQLTLPKLPQRSAVSHKGDIGRLLAIGGGQGMPGAIRLASEAALRSGAALVSVCCHRDNRMIVMNGRPELMLIESDNSQLVEQKAFQKAKVLLCGPGLGQDHWAQQNFHQVMASGKICVLDADALHLLAAAPKKDDNWVLTPHPGEAAALLQSSVAEVEQDRFTAVNNIAQQYGGICLLKGAGSLICDGESTWINTSGNSGMASGGMGDVLSGIIAALLMQMPNAIDAVRLAVYLHGLAADHVAQHQGKIGMLASDLLPYIWQLLNQESKT
ncbi:bifunctional NAD(P)H-hydrate repair enzyme [Thalassotalea insulae]|uniref:Bifunctional NAD(P)H-hydrate repair enzyme n=1 Tax=Thalassotalea insulae TaxID=2056778 RepID=A0ABQ6GQA0_9GAMM|nr:NAD(P)H-hydrate dehydratase [Thalassotalea insulae]GLX78153.1 bifunctional NAD(P)H-hydrate repair enzyme [Thalassotalea insulae]